MNRGLFALRRFGVEGPCELANSNRLIQPLADALQGWFLTVQQMRGVVREYVDKRWVVGAQNGQPE